MALAQRSSTRNAIWPGFVDALAALVMVTTFLLMIFMAAQFFLNDVLLNRNQALEQLDKEIAKLSTVLNLERGTSARLRGDLAALSEALETERKIGKTLRNQLANITGQLEVEREASGTLRGTVTRLKTRLESAAQEIEAGQQKTSELIGKLAISKDERRVLEAKIAEGAADLKKAYTAIKANERTIEVKLSKIASLEQDVIAMKALRDRLSEDIAASKAQLAEKSGEAEKYLTQLGEAEKDAIALEAKITLTIRQLVSLRETLATLNATLEASEAKSALQEKQIQDLGQRLNVALVSKVEELARYRSEFFGRLRNLLGSRSDITIVGDRFIFQSEVLFPSSSDQLEQAGKDRLEALVQTLREIIAQIPQDIDWILRVDGHTDKRPITTSRFPSNWELSTARAISVVRFLASHGIDPKRLAAAGFGEFQPIDLRDDAIAYRRNRRIELKLDQR